MKRLPTLLGLALALLVCLGAGARQRRTAGPSPEDVAKADYIYLEALRAKSQERHDAAFQLLQQAITLNPNDKEAALEMAPYLLALSDSASREKAVGIMGAYYDENPSDYQAATRYGSLLERMGRSDDARHVWNRIHTFYPERPELTTVLAEALVRTGETADRRRALELYDSLELQEGPSIQLSGSKIQVYMNVNDTAAILAEADRLRQARPGNVDFTVFSGDVYNAFGLPERALDFYNHACELDPTSGYAYYSKANFYKEQGDSAAYDREVLEALKKESLDFDTKFNILMQYIREVHSDTVEQPRIRELFDTLVVQHPVEQKLRSLYASFLLNQHDYPAAIEQEEQTLGLEPADPEGWDLLSSLYMQTEQYDQALGAIDRAMHYYPDDPSQIFKKGSILAYRKEYAAANDCYRKALELTDSADVNAISAIYTSIADNLYQMEMPDSALVLYDRALLYNPDNQLALNNSAYFMACSGVNLDEALSRIEKAIEMDPDNPTDLDTYAWVLFKRADYAKAREVMDRTLELTPDKGAEILEHAGDIYFMVREPQRALEFWKEALKLDPDNELLARKVKHKTYYYE